MLKIKTILQKLENFNISNLDLIERQQFEKYSETLDKEEALLKIINNSENDLSQLSENLSLIAEEINQFENDL